MSDQTQHETTGHREAASHEELLRQIADHEAQIQIKSHLMDNMAYQIRTLSNAVIGFSDLLLTEDLDSSQIEYVQEINHAGYGLSALVSEVLDWTQVLSGKMEMEKERFDLLEMIDRIDQILAAAAKEKGLGHRVVKDPKLPNYLFTDENRLMRCLLNLIANAIRYTPRGSVQVHVAMEERGAGGPTIRFDVIDSGVGIDAERVPCLFEPGSDYQVNSDQGLLALLNMGFRITAGLPLTKQLIEILGGSVDVKSEVGAGSTFSLRIPVGVQPIAATSSEATKSESPWPDSDTAAGPILLVEDQQANRTVISLMLEALGAAVETAEDGEQALCKVERNSYSLILMDLKMPKMDGYEATRQLRNRNIEIPIVALSAKVVNKNEDQEIRSLFDGFLMKPVDSKKLLEMLQQFVAGFEANSTSGSEHKEEVVVLEYRN